MKVFKSFGIPTLLLFIGFALTYAQSQKTDSSLPYTHNGHGPSLLLLHDASIDHDWSQAASQLAGRFEVILIDVSKISDNANSVQRLREFISRLKLDDSRISGSPSSESLAVKYALTYPHNSQSFTLPSTSEDMQILADLITSTPISKS